ncbi:MAG: 50S ribosomal protein L29 [Thermodesulfobacteriota bacterium]|nr:50S ribosomal protein L29 [Thermodesulfobacteriota bacterium]
MKASEARDLNIEERKQKVVELAEELFNLRFQHEIGQLENPQKMKQTKREIARLKTIINEEAEKNKAGEK